MRDGPPQKFKKYNTNEDIEVTDESIYEISNITSNHHEL